MPFELDYEPGVSPYVVIRLVGDLTLEEFREGLSRAHAAKDAGAIAAVADVTQMASLRRLLEYMLKSDWRDWMLPHMRTAILTDSPWDGSLRALSLVLQTARLPLRIFRNEDDAIAWLMEAHPPPEPEARPWAVELLPDSDVIAMWIGPGAELNDSQRSAAIRALLPAGEQGRMLVDATGLPGLFSMPSIFQALRVSANGSRDWIRAAAVLVPDAQAREARFWEDTAVTRGMNLRVFDDRMAAVEWLLTQ